MVVSIQDAEHYTWGEISEGWHLLRRDDFSVIQERVPAGGAEVLHYHERARQFFYVLEGEATLLLDTGASILRKGDGLEIAPGAPHRLMNRSGADLHFLVISIPSTRGDRIDLA